MENQKNFVKLFAVLFASLISFKAVAAEKVMAIPKDGTKNKQIEMSVDALPQIARNFTPRIVGGTTAARNEFPEFAALYLDGAAFGDPTIIVPICGATLIANNKVLTAAHCTVDFAAQFLYVVPNFYSFGEVTFPDLIPVSSKAEHPSYNVNTSDSDASVLTLNRASNPALGSLYGGDEDLTGETATAIGVGVTTEDGSQPDVLRKVDVPVVSNQVCRSSYGASAITSRMICAGLAQGGRDSCQGDSGGPLSVSVSGKRAQAGIVSFGLGCARPNFYGVYSRVSELISFITQQAPTARVITGNVSITPILPLLLDEDN